MSNLVPRLTFSCRSDHEFRLFNIIVMKVKTACKILSEFEEGHVKQIALSYKFIELQNV